MMDTFDLGSVVGAYRLAAKVYFNSFNTQYKLIIFVVLANSFEFANSIAHRF